MDLIEEIKPTLVGGLRELRLERSNKWICIVARILEEGESSGKFRKVQDIDHTTVDATNPYEVK